MADRKVTALTELTAPVAADVFPVIDVSESANANKNKKIQLTTVLKNIPDGNVSAPSVGFTSDSGLTGFFRVASNEIGVSANQTLIGSFTTTGFQLGSGTPAAQLHLFSTDTSDQVIIENSDTGADNAPDLVLFRNSASPAADDNLGNLVYRGEDSAGNAHDYASVVASIEDTTNGSEDGILDIMSSAAGTLASRIRLKNNLVGIHESDPLFPLHLTTTAAGQAFQIECNANDAASGADLMLYHRRGASGAGQDNDVLSTIIYKGKNDAGTPEEVNYAAIESVIVDASDATEDGKLNLQVMTAGTLTTKVAIDASGIDVTGTVTDDGATHDGDVTFTGDSANVVFDKSDNALEFADSAKATFGADSDLQIFHDSANSYIKDNGTGQLRLQTNELLVINPALDEDILKASADGSVEAYFDGSKKFQTASYGCLITGTIVTTSGNVRCQSDSSKITAGAGNDLTAFHDGTDSFIENTNGNLHIRPKSSEEGIKLIPDGSVEIYHDNVKKCETSADGLDFPDNSKLQLGDSQDALIYHSGSQLNIDNNTGNIFYDTPGSHYFRVGGGNETAIQAAANGSVDLYHDNVKKLETTSSGLTVTGSVTASTGILFGSDTADANKIQDYEEGTWTPTVVSGGTIGTPQFTCTYTKIGRLVTINADIHQLSDTTSSTHIKIGGLPYVPSGTGTSGKEYSAVCHGERYGGKDIIVAYLLYNSGSWGISFRFGVPTNHYSGVSHSDISDDGTDNNLRFTLTYELVS